MVKIRWNDWSGQMQMGGQVFAITQVALPHRQQGRLSAKSHFPDYIFVSHVFAVPG